MVKKLFSIALVAVLVLSLSVPAFCSGQGSSTRRYSAVQFDSVAYSDNAFISEYGGNVFAESSVCLVNTPGFEFYGEIQTEIPTFYSRTVVTTTDYFSPIRLRAENVVVRWADLHFIITAGIPDTSGGVYVQYAYSIAEVRTGVTSYYWGSTPVSGSVSNARFDFVDIVEGTAPASSGFDSDAIVFFDYIDLTVEGLAVSATGDYTIEQNTLLAPLRFSEWFADQSLPITQVPTGGVNLTAWLATSLRSVLDFELLPGIDISSLLEFVVVIALVFWFLTLLI